MVSIAQIGAGHWGKNLVRNYAELGVLAAIVEQDAAQANALSGQHGVPIRSLEDVLNDKTIDGVSFATPAELHAKHALKALSAGKHVFVEKPLALTLSDAEQVLTAARKARRHVMVGHLLQYHPIFLHLKGMVERGTIGKILHIYSNRLSLGKFRVEENVWWSFAPHDVSMILALVGEEPSNVSAQGFSYVTAGLVDWATAQLTFDSGIGAHLNVSWMHPFKEQRLTVVGENGMLVFEDSQAQWEHRLAFYPHKINRTPDRLPVPSKGDVTYIEVPQSEPLRDECQHFIDCISAGTLPRTNGLEGLRVLRVLQQGEAQIASSIGKRGGR